MQTATRTQAETERFVVPKSMQAAVYYGREDVRLETVPVPEIGPGELLVRVHTCGICGTDLKKIATGSWRFITSPAVSVITAGTGFSPSVRSIRRSEPPPDSSPPAEDSHSTFVSWIGSS